ncbi:MAG: hemerythrin domain-containing protein [Leptothrix sp. (in: b-proteobacteria)]
MSLLTWSEELLVQHPRMDATHQEFVEHVNAVDAAVQATALTTSAAGSDAATTAAPALLAAYDALIEHTVEHFAQEDRWMVATGFTPDNCHSSQHSQVLAVLREVRRLAADEGKPALIGQLMPELVQWFTQHAQAADNGLAGHLRDIGYDTETGQTARPLAEAISGCGSNSCG